MKLVKASGIVLAVSLFSACAWAEVINGVNIDFVTIGNSGNAADTDSDPERFGYGSVGYTYQIGKFEVTYDQFQASGVGSGNESGTGAEPVGRVSWHEAARYCNWLTSSNDTLGAYSISGGLVTGVDRASARTTYGTVYVLPTEDEWYKAAYYSGSAYSLYANGTSTAPTAGTEANYDNVIGASWDVGSGIGELNGTFDMMGNLWEWTESAFDGNLDFSNEDIAFRGGSYNLDVARLASAGRFPGLQDIEDVRVGMRIVAIPEPGTMSLMGLSTISLFATRGIRRRKRLGQSILPVRQDPLCDRFQTLDALESEQTMFDEATELDIWLDTAKEHLLAFGHYIYEGWKQADKEIWNRLVAAHERRLVRRTAFRAALKGKALGALDSFLERIMK